MIVPHANLLWWVALLGLPAAVAGALFPALVPPALALGGVLGALALLDATLAPGRLAGLAARLPGGVARLTQRREGTIEVEFENASRRPMRLSAGLPFPEHFETDGETIAVALPGGVAASRARWRVRPLRRGQAMLAQCYVERSSPLGLWRVRATLPLGGEVRVYPDLMPECRSLAALFLPRGSAGVRQRRQVGKGREFEKLREYIPGDAMGDIHWRATAKRGRPITKLFQIERTQEVYLIIDTSRLSARRGGKGDCGEKEMRNAECEMRNEGAISNFKFQIPQSILDRYLTAALVTCQAAQRQGDLFGLIAFSDRVHGFIPARNGRAHYTACRDAIYTLQPRLVTPDFDELFTTLRLKLRRRALLVFLTSLDDPTLAESFQRRLDLICRHHLVLTGMLAPPQARELFDGPGVTGNADLYQRLGGHMLWSDLRLLDRSLARRGVRLLLLGHEAMATELVSAYLEIKQRQLL